MKKEQKKDRKTGHSYIWPLLPIPLLVILAVYCAEAQEKAAAAVLIFTAAYTLFALFVVLAGRKRLAKRMMVFAGQMNRAQQRQLDEMPVPLGLFQENGDYVSANRAFLQLPGEFFENPTHLRMLDEALWSRAEEGKCAVLTEELSCGGRAYRARLSVMGTEPVLRALVLEDVTEQKAAMERAEAMMPVVGRIYIDNYEELMNSAETVRQSLLAAIIERKLVKYFAGFDGVVNKLDRDKYLLLMNKREFSRAAEARFPILDEIRTVSMGNTVQPTVSIGFGADGETLAADEMYARMAMDLCLGRGGDQVVVRTPEGPVFYGGKTQQQGSSARVKARVKARALRELLVSRERVLIMGHRNPDMDAFGAAVGIFRAARIMGKEAHIVVNTAAGTTRQVIESFAGSGDYPADMIVKSEEALELIDGETAVVVVDTNRAGITDCPELLERSGCTVVLDHHRMSSDSIRDATLSYIEPYASSACEMAAEILQYFDDDIRLSPQEADALYAGISMDTNHFENKTGVRTFEAAAYLRRQGADMTRVRKLFRERMEEYRAKAEAIRAVETFQECFAFAELDGTGLESPTVAGARAANELLDIVGIKASFVFTHFEEQVYISARSIDEVNVQLIMERLGGGGHLSVAGAQLSGCSTREAMERTQTVIKQMIEEGAITCR